MLKEEIKKDEKTNINENDFKKEFSSKTQKTLLKLRKTLTNIKPAKNKPITFTHINWKIIKNFMKGINYSVNQTKSISN